MRASHLATLLAVLALEALAFPSRAEACGGFFCGGVPVDQSGERIAFARTATGVEVHVQIQYSGDAAKFAWILPVHGQPTLSAGSDALFTFLDGQLRPRFLLDWQPASCGA